MKEFNKQLYYFYNSLIAILLIAGAFAGYYIYDLHIMHDNTLNLINSMNNDLSSKDDQLLTKMNKLIIDQNSVNANLTNYISQNNNLISNLDNKLDLQVSTLIDEITTLDQVSTERLEALKQESEASLSKIQDDLSDISSDFSKLKSTVSADFSDIFEDAVRSTTIIYTNVGSGTGSIISDDGYIITNAHVASGSSNYITVKLYDETLYNAIPVAWDYDLDLAILWINQSTRSFDLERDSRIAVGNKVIAIGSPKGLEFSVSQGIISSTTRILDDTGIKYIQSDVAINPGNSGGPLISVDGNLVGINTLKVGEAEGLGFAIPASVIDDFINVAEDELNININ